MPDEDELEHLVEDELLVEALMGWDSDACECAECECARFRDSLDERCPECREGGHWTNLTPTED